MRTRLSFYLWIYLFLIQILIYFGRAQILDDDPSDPLSIDTAYLTVRNRNYSGEIQFMYNIIVCEKCNFETMGTALKENSNQTFIIKTTYAYDFQIFNQMENQKLLCQIESYHFSEHGSYVLEMIVGNDQTIACTVTQTTQPDAYWLPLIIAMSVVGALILFIQIWYHISKSQCSKRIISNDTQSAVINSDYVISLPNNSIGRNDVAGSDDIIKTLTGINRLPYSIESTNLSSNSLQDTKILPKRLQSLDTFRGFSLMVMIFVNYGGGGYWFFKHSIWNGLTVADLVFPWFNWMMGVSIVLSQRSLREKNVRKINIFLKICQRTFILCALGLIIQGGYQRWIFIRIFGVLQRLALCYFLTAVIVLIFDDKEDEPYPPQWSTDNEAQQSFRKELSKTLFHFWPQWFFISLLTLAWVLTTFLLRFDDCPRGYLGPGGKHEYGKYQNCTGGAAGYIDRLLFKPSHLDNHPTCKDIYDTQVPYDPEGLLGILTGTLLCYLGVHAGHTFAYSTGVRRVCAHWIISGIICGSIGLVLSKGGQSDSWIPINKNLWSLSFVLILAGLAFIIMTILYLFVDIYKWFNGQPFLSLGMNSIVIYVGHEICSKSFPIQFQVEETTHTELLAMHLYGVIFWTIVAGLMYRKRVFISI